MGLDGLKHLQELYLDYSFIDKIFLHNVGVMSSLRVLTLWNINLNGTLPNQGWCELSNLQELDLSENGFNGMLPSCLEDLTSIRILDLSFNQFIGNLTSSPLSNLTALEYLILSYNHFESQSHLFHFVTIQSLSNNHMSGKLPRWMGNMSDLMGISMFSNHFEGPIPVEFCKLGNLEFLDLSVNNLSGSIPSCFNQSTVKHVHLNRNQLSGLMAHTALVTLDLSDNHLTGTIPSWIGSLHVLSILPLKFNNFEGEIPSQLCQLKQLSILDLSENNFSGSIPLSFCEIPFETTHEKSSLEIIAMAGMAMVALWSFVDGSKSIGDHYQMDAVNGFGSITFPSLDVQQKVEFTTKYESYAYKGNILDYMSRVDLSRNHLIRKSHWKWET
ncbi:putative receptor-like protein 16 [Camellia sinensis]|uniref:putative receptor-like protein 16 n=1 Tax=Camellia sinensis TaxID=4442 RepID=UPI001035D48B|nr:putative receptor-like protein 16 [Camellia sinensis]